MIDSDKYCPKCKSRLYQSEDSGLIFHCKNCDYSWIIEEIGIKVK